MFLTNGATQQSVPIRVDNVVYQDDGCLLVEAMFSKLIDLTAPSVDMAARLHPTKAQAFESIVTGQCSVTSEGKQIGVIPDVQLHVNRPQGGIAIRHFSEFLEGCRSLRDRGESDSVKATHTSAGFERVAEPVLREMRDGSLLLIFAFIPPLAIEDNPAKAKRFEMATFGKEIEKAAGGPVIWDDKEIFVVRHPQSDTIERIQQFLLNYWKKTK